LSQTFRKNQRLDDFLIRPAKLEDAESVNELLNLCSMEVVGKKLFSVNDLLISWQAPDFQLGTSSRLVLSPEGHLVGFCLINDTIEPYVRINLRVQVHPDFRDNGVGESLLQWGEHRAKQALSRAPSGAQVFITVGLFQNDLYHQQLVEKFGLQAVRHFFHMEIEFDRPPERPEIPKGIVIRPYDEQTELEPLAIVFLDSFQDHYGFANRTAEKMLKNVRYEIANDPKYTPEMWFVAVDGDQIAGFSICVPKTPEDPGMGYVNVLGVRRPWRKRGLGMALLRHSFVEFYKNGCKRAGLDVDSSSLTGATRLYEKGGMHIVRQMDMYKKVLREGKDITNA